MKRSQSKLKSPCVKKKLDIKLQMNEHGISIHVNNSQIQIVQPKLTTWKYKAKLNAEATSGGVL